MSKSKKYDIDCKFLNTSYGEGYWLCHMFLKPTNPDMCKYCQNRQNRKYQK